MLTQAGFVEKLAAGIYTFLPLGQRVLTKVCQIVREEMEAIGAQEILMPALHPIKIWEDTGRDRVLDDVFYKTKGAGDKDFVFGPSHEEVVTPLVAKYVQSYKDLPLSVFQLQTKYRNEPRAKSGLLRGREFGMKDMYSFHRDEESLDQFYNEAIKAYFNVFERCGVKAHLIEASGGAFSDQFSHEFSVETPAGEDTILISPVTGKAQNMEVATGKVVNPHDPEEKELEMKEVKVERGTSIKANAEAHDVPESKILKTVIYKVEDKFIGVLIRGDLQVNELKLQGYLQKAVRTASDKELEVLGLVKGFISPIRLETDLEFIADHSIKNIKNFVTGGNVEGVDLINVNIGRDFVVDQFVDLVEVKSGFLCEESDEPLEEITAVEAGNIFRLGTKYSDAVGFKYTDENGELKPVIMGCYGIGLSRLVGAVVEASHDENGIIWPINVAPYLVHLITLGNDPDVQAEADKLYEELLEKGHEVLYDDRDERAGVKFADADLIGIPVRLVVSKRTLEKNSVEWKRRSEKEGQMLEIDHVLPRLNALLES